MAYQRAVTLTDDLLAPRANNLTLVRLVLASSVIYTHSYWAVNGATGEDELSGLLGAPVSVYAVDGFFFLSGFLVYGSLQRLGSSGRFLVARLARLWPALFASVVGTVAVGLALTTVPPASYFQNETGSFLFGNLSLAFGAYYLTGVQCGDLPCNVNGSLWTLPWEMRCYGLLALLGVLGLARPRIMKRAILPATLLGALVWDLPWVQDLVYSAAGNAVFYHLTVFDRLWPLFALGIAAYIWRDRIPLSWAIFALLFLLNIAAHYLGVGLHVRGIFIGYAVLCAGMLSARNGAVSGRWPDYSYGMYIYAFPVMMGIGALWPMSSHLALTAVTFLATLPLAALSWHLIEKPVVDWFRAPRRLLQPIET